jgi:hypothetical protein
VGLWGGCSVGSGEGSLTRGTGDVMFSRVGIARTVFGGFWWGYLVWALGCSRLGVLGRGIRSREEGVFGRPLSFSLGGGECVCSSLWLWCSDVFLDCCIFDFFVILLVDSYFLQVCIHGFFVDSFGAYNKV